MISSLLEPRHRREFLRIGAGAALGLVVPTWASGTQTSRPPARRILYIAGHVDRLLVERLGPTGFNVGILAFLYARYSAQHGLRLSYNGVAPSRLPRALAANLRRLRHGYGEPKTFLISLGGWGNRATFEAIRSAGVERSLAQIEREITGPLGLDGLDLDLEPSTAAENTPAGWHAVHDDLGTTLVELTNRYMRRHPGHVVTHAPIASVAARLYARNGHVRGVPGSLFEATRSPRGNNIAWLNVQFYEAGDPKPTSIPEFYRDQLVRPMLTQRASTGIPRPWEALIPGFEPRYHQSLPVCEQALRALNRTLAPWGSVGGVFLWQYGQIAATVGTWGAGLQQALLTST